MPACASILRLGLAMLLVLSARLLPAAATVSTAYFDLAFLNLERDGAPVQCLLQLKPNVEKALLRPEPRTDDLVAELELWVEARIPRTGQAIGEWRFRDRVRQAVGSQANDLLRAYPLHLPPGAYDMHVQVRDRVNGRVYFEALPFECRPSTPLPWLSDLQLELVKSFGPVSLAQPLYGLHIENQPDTLRFSAELRADRAAMLSVRAVLYFQQAGQGRPGDATRMQVRTYATQQQRSDVFQVVPGTSVYQGGFPLSDAPDGEYLLELSFFQDGAMVCSNSRSFVLDWPRLREIFADLDAAIERMVWIASPAERERLSGIRDADQQLREFLNWWERRTLAGQGGTEAMKRYFSRVFEAEAAYAEGWLHDRGRTLVLYGQPDFKEDIQLPGAELLVWVYRAQNIVHLFRREDGEYHRLEI